MRNKKNRKLIQTEHFLIRAWERGYYSSSIDKLVKEMSTTYDKSYFIINRENLRKRGVKKTKSSYLVIVVKKNLLITLFELNNLYEFLKANSNARIEIIG